MLINVTSDFNLIHLNDSFSKNLTRRIARLIYFYACLCSNSYPSPCLLAVDGNGDVEKFSIASPTPSDLVRNALDNLPTRGSCASIENSKAGLVAVAVGSGIFSPKNDVERALPEATKKSRATRAAIISAKAALAEQLNSTTSTFVAATISGSRGESVRSETVVALSRTILSHSWPWKIQATPEDSGYSARAWIYFPDDRAQLLAASTLGGLPSFEDNRAAANAVIEWISNGLCDSGVLNLLVGKSGSEKLCPFGVGVAPSGPSARTVAEMKATASLMRETGGPTDTIEGNKSLTRETVQLDPLSAEGNRELIKEEFFKNRRQSTSGVIKVAADFVTKRLPDGQTCVVVWGAE
jgi:hypothetical protein